MIDLTVPKLYEYKIITRAGDNPLTWFWDQGVSRFRSSNGQFMARAKVLEYTSQSMLETGKATETLASYVSNGALNSGSFGSLMREEIKKEYIRQYLLGRGGVNMMAPSDWGRIGGMLREQYRYLDGFVAEVEAGNLSEAQIAARARMYINSAREGFERATALVARDAGYDEEAWVLDGGEHCGDCEGYAAEGWQEIGYFPFPGDGSTQCLTNCLCSKEYRQASTGNIFQAD
jgi:hypothetical protein